MNPNNTSQPLVCGNQSHGPDLSSVFTRQALPVLYSLIFIGGMILNGLAALIFFQLPSNSGLMVYLKNMVVADLLILLSIPTRVATDLGLGGWHLRLVVCRYTAVLFYLGMYTSIVFVSLISLERYIKIVHTSSLSPQPCSLRLSSYMQRVNIARGLAFISWSLLLTCMLPNTLLTNLPGAEGCSCMQLKSELGKRWHKVSVHMVVAIFWVTLVLLAFCYSSIAWRVYQSYQRVQRDSSKAGRRSNRSIFSLLVVFFLCFVPYHICRVPYTLSQSSNTSFNIQDKFHLFQAKEATMLLTALNVCLDPIVYFLMCRTFRESLLCKVSMAQAENRRPSVTNGLSVSNL